MKPSIASYDQGLSWGKTGSQKLWANERLPVAEAKALKPRQK